MPNDDNGDVRPFEPLWPLPLPLAQAEVGIGDSSTPRKPANCCEAKAFASKPLLNNGDGEFVANKWLPTSTRRTRLRRVITAPIYKEGSGTYASFQDTPSRPPRPSQRLSLNAVSTYTCTPNAYPRGRSRTTPFGSWKTEARE